MRLEILVVGVILLLSLAASAFAQSELPTELSVVGRVVGDTPAELKQQLMLDNLDLSHSTYVGPPLGSGEVRAVVRSQFPESYSEIDEGGWLWDSEVANAVNQFGNQEYFVIEKKNGDSGLATDLLTLEHARSWGDSFLESNPLFLFSTDYGGLYLPKQESFMSILGQDAVTVAANAGSSSQFTKSFICNLGGSNSVGEAFKEARNEYYSGAHNSNVLFIPTHYESIGTTLYSYELYGNPAAKVSVPGYDASAVEEHCRDFVRDFDSAASVSLAGGDGAAGLDGGGLGDGLVAYYDFEEMAGHLEDRVGGGDSVFERVSARGVQGVNGLSWDFEADSKDWVGLPASVTESLQGSSPRTTSAWVNLESAVGGVVVSWGHGTGSCTADWKLVSSSKVLYYGFGGCGNVEADVGFGMGEWHHVVFTFDGLQSRIYVDGVLVAEGSGPVSVSGDAADIGAEHREFDGYVSGNFDGLIDEVGLWSRALTSDEVKELYNGGAGVFCEGRPCSFSSGGGEAVPVTLMKSFEISGYGVVGDGGFSYVVVDGASLLREDGKLVLPQISLSEKFPLKTVITDVRASFSAPVDLAADVPEWLGGPVERRCLVNSEDAGVDYSHSFAENSQQLAVSLAPVGVVDCQSGSLRLYTEITYEVDYLSYSPVMLAEVNVPETAIPNERVVADVVLRNVKGDSFIGELVLQKGDVVVAEVPVVFSGEDEIFVGVPFYAGDGVGVSSYRLGFVQDGEVKSFYDFSVDVSALELAVETPLTAGEGGEVLLLVTNLLGEPLDVVVASELVRDGQPLAGAVDVTLKPGLNMVDLQYAGLRRETGSYELLASVYHGGGKESMAVTLITNHPPVLQRLDVVVVSEGEVVLLEPVAVDVDGDDVEITYSGSMESGVWQTEVGDAGEYEVLVVASDGLLEDSETVKVTVVELPDLDGDGFVAGVDCDDSDASVYPGAVEVCNEVDDDCSGEVDEGLTRSEACGFCETQEFACSDGEWVKNGRCVNGGVCAPGDADSLKCGYWHFRTRTCNEQCEWERWGQCVAVGECVPGQREKQRRGSSDVGACSYGERARVCGDDYNWGGWGRCVGAVEPSKEICDGVDNDCDGIADENVSCGEEDVCLNLLNSISASLGSSCGDVSYSAAVDVNRDGAVDIKDLTAVGRRFGSEEWCAEQLKSNTSVCG